MRAPLNRRVFVVGYAAATALGADFAATWRRAVNGEAGFRRLTRCEVDTRSNVVGEIPDWNPAALPYVNAKEAAVWNAGCIFLGPMSSEPLGDYFAGPNHILPTNGTAKFFSPLSVDDFIKKSSIISYSREALQDVYKDIISFAQNEGLDAHANSIRVRFEEV